MTQEQTRQLGIEFERRLKEIYPGFALKNKLTSDTIYSFLNEYQDIYVKTLFLSEDQVQSGTRQQRLLSDSVSTLVTKEQLQVEKSTDSDTNSDIVELPEDYYYYIRSNSIVTSTYKGTHIKPVTMSNLVIKEDDATKVIQQYYNNNGIIRNPLVLIEDKELHIIHDNYTNIYLVELTYYRHPYRFNLIGYDDNNKQSGAVHSYCELPYKCFNELVDGAVNLYISNYKFKLSSGNSNRQPQQVAQQQQQPTQQKQEDEQ